MKRALTPFRSHPTLFRIMNCTPRISLRLWFPVLLLAPVFAGLHDVEAAEKPRIVNAANLAEWQTEARQSHPTVSAARGRMEAARFAQAEVGVAGNMLELEVAKAALELALADEALVIVQEESAWIEKMSANAKEKLKDPAASAAEPLRLQSELAQQLQKVETAKR